MNLDRQEKALAAATVALKEYFDTVQIFVTKTKDDENDKTTALSLGRGNLFARVGQVGIWLDKVQSSLVNQELFEEIEEQGGGDYEEGEDGVSG